MKLSIIVPVYNTDSSILERCLLSLLGLKGFKYEILIINDGSSDKFSNDYDLLIKKIGSSAIKYYYKKNGGVSSARNFGIEKSCGKYIMFVDSDDILYSENFDSKDLLLNYDIIIYKMSVIANVISNKNGLLESSKPINTQEALEYYVDGKIDSSWAKLYKKEFLFNKKIKFMTSLIQGEDAIFNLDLISSGATIYYKNSNIYGYYLDINTLSNRWINNPDKMFKNYCYLMSRKYDVIKQFNDNIKCKKVEQMVESIIDGVFSKLLELSVDFKKYKNVINDLSDIIKQIDIKKYNFNYSTKIKYFLIKNNNKRLISFISRIRKIYLKYLKRDY